MSSPRMKIYVSKKEISRLLDLGWDEFLFLISDCDRSWNDFIERLHSDELYLPDVKELSSKEILYQMNKVKIDHRKNILSIDLDNMQYHPDTKSWSYHEQDYYEEEDDIGELCYDKIFQERLANICKNYDIVFQEEYYENEKPPVLIELINLWYAMRTYLNNNFLSRMGVDTKN
jgi:hypothetical protein